VCLPAFQVRIGVQLCGDASEAPLCDRGNWRCPDGTVEPGLCTCQGPARSGCTCTEAGWLCVDAGSGPDRPQVGEVQPEARAEVAGAPEIGSDVPVESSPDSLPKMDASGSDATKDACDVGCSVMGGSGSFCQQGEVQWTCGGQFDGALFNASCRDPATGVQRYCCPPSFLAACR
jgi:hypothetical protein